MPHFPAFLLSADFFKINFFEKLFQEYDQSVKHFGSDQAQHSVGPDLGPSCWQMGYQQTTLGDNEFRLCFVLVYIVYYVVEIFFACLLTLYYIFKQILYNSQKTMKTHTC